VKNYKERRHQKPKVKGPSQERRVGRKAFEAFAKAWAQQHDTAPPALPEGYTLRDYYRAAGIKTKVFAVPVGNQYHDVMARCLPG
jgi:hypothetical protein